MSAGSSTQRRIVEWFDATYERKGSRYLRPLRAYFIFPELLRVQPGDLLLDVACGSGVLLRAASDYTQGLYGCDISAVAIGRARALVPQAQVFVANAEALPYETGSFDFVTCIGSLERMLDRRRALAEMLRVGTSSARYCLMVRNSNTGRWRYWHRSLAREPAHGHADADTLTNWTTLLEGAGFRIVSVLPDQYPLMRRQRWRGLFLRSVDFRRPIESIEPLERANEFIFLLEKRP